MSNVATIVSFFRSKGLSDDLIAGILGNLSVESGFDPTSSNPKEGAIGLVQWEGNRRTALQQWAHAHGGTETDLNMQLGFLWHEMNSSESGAWAQVQHATSASQAAQLWDQFYERSSGSTRQQRVNNAVSYLQSGFKNISSPSNSGGGAVTNSAGETSLGGGAPTAAQYKNDLGDLGILLTKIPALNKLLSNALATDQPLNDFLNSVQNSAWWKNHSDTVRHTLATKFSDPATWDQQLSQLEDQVSRLANQLGMPLNAKQLNAISTHALLTGQQSDSGWLTEQISAREDYSKLKDLSVLQGGMANTAQQLQQMASDYGFTWNASQVAQRAQDILSGQTTIDTYKQRLQSWAASAFPGFRKEIMAGTTVKDLADPYMQSMSNLLEVDPGQLSVYTPMIRKALQGTKDKTGDWTPQTLTDFEQQVRSDPRWATTNNAKQTMSSALLQIGNIFGFGPTSSG